MRKGQITIYFTLVFTLMLSIFLSAFDAARGAHLKVRSENAVLTAIHSTFGEYHKVLFERYGLLFLDTSYMTDTPDFHKVEDRMGEYLNYNLKTETEQSLLFARDWYGIEDYNLSLTNIRLATDDWGDVMKRQAADYMKNYVGGDVLDNIQGWIHVVEKYEISGEKFEEYHENIMQETKEAWQENHLAGEEKTPSEWMPSLDFQTKYIDAIISNYSDSEVFGISTKCFNPLEHASYRWKLHGTEVLEETDWDITADILFHEYILQKMGNFQNVREDSKLDYQVEYILFGQMQDSVNWMIMVESLFAFRGAANLTTILMDSEAQEIIKSVSQLAGLLEIPPQLVEAMIDIGWAAAEGAADVVQLLEGEKVPLLKSPKDFRVSLNGLLEGIATQVTEEKGEGSLDASEMFELGYEDYLRLFLYLEPSFTKTFRCMDMMEADIRLTEGNEYFRMDACADAVSMEIGIQSEYNHFYLLQRKYSYF